MKNKKKSVYLPLTHALAWIIGSTLLISGASHLTLKYYLKEKQRSIRDPQYVIRSIIQTGPQREALKTEYLAELLGISVNHPVSSLIFDFENAQQRLLKSPLISQAEIKLIKPNTLYIDYTVRQPIALLEDYENIALDKEGYPFPFHPFFSPKHLPPIYFGLSAFDSSIIDQERPTVQWGTPLKGKYVKLAFDLLTLLLDSKISDFFSVKRIDVSNAFSESYGTREIVLITEDLMVRTIEGKETQLCFPRILRLSTKNYAQELGNYLKLRTQLLEEERKTAVVPQGAAGQVIRMKEKIIDFRIQKLAFIEEQKLSRSFDDRKK